MNSTFQFDGKDDLQTPDVGEDTILLEGDYEVFVPPGQRVVIRYEAAI